MSPPLRLQEAYELLPPEGSRSAGWILSKLSAGTIRIGRFVKERLDEATLRKKVEFRAGRLRYFEIVGNDDYTRLPGWNGPLGLKVRKGDRALQKRDAPDVGAPP
ncbi:hypothetical protein MKK65_10600 [Methylobacterium sp. J-001]|uniref:hypothetical protein n=1 Tax=Methylobacterium sp. J-001 TaxID=2836609 RepID=UPI001FBA7F5C|nr:hypothetical protein [Methylobacterium sp. J-001]MCJ2117013.1 hypothetical protein [Methylobacterium sp. J-001]